MLRIENKPDITSVLSNLIGLVREFSLSIDQYFYRIGEQQPMPFTRLSAVTSRRPILAFSDWVELENASNRWDALYEKVIKPLKRRDFEFVFHLGDVAKKKVFEVDEVLDIIGDFSNYGKATLILDTHEADTLWCKLNGQRPDTLLSNYESPSARERFFSLFGTTSIDSLVILDGARAVQISQDGQLNLAGRSKTSFIAVINDRVRFGIGYQLGLLLELAPSYRMALGLAVSEGYQQSWSVAGSALLLNVLLDWLGIL